VELHNRAEEFQRLGMGLAAISYDSPELLKTVAAKRGITFPLLSDTGSEVIRRYGILNTSVAPDQRSYGIPHPGTFILDAEGRVTARFFEASYQQRYTVSSIAVKIGSPLSGVDRDATRSETPHLVVTAFTTDAQVAPGTRFSLVLDIAPKTDMHVYAPGQDNYQTVALKLDGQPSLTAHPIDYPASEIYVFRPLDERVKVYQKPFRLVQDVTVPVTPEIRALSKEPEAALTIRGALAYQACDHATCFPPADVPLTWSVKLKPLEQ